MAKKLISIDDSKTGEAALPEAVNTVLRNTYGPISRALPSGGAAGQILSKATTGYEWIAPPSGGGASTPAIPALTSESTPCEMLAQLVDFKAGFRRGAVAGDSTVNDGNDPPRKLLLRLAQLTPANVGFSEKAWSSGNNSYGNPIVVREGSGTPASGGVVLEDNFNRTAAELVGSTTSGGQVWAGGSGAWSSNGSTASANSTTSALGFNTGSKAITATAVFNVITTPPAASSQARLAVGATQANFSAGGSYVWAQLTCDTQGNCQVTVWKRIGSTNTQLVNSTTINGLTANSPDVQVLTMKLEIAIQAVTLTLTVGGVDQVITASVTESDTGVLSTFAGVAMPANASGTFRLDNITFAGPTVAAVDGTGLEIWNAAVGGTTLAYQLERLATMYPSNVHFDWILVTGGHNHGTQTPAEFLAIVDDFITAFKAAHPETKILISSQNPQFAPAPAATIEAHARRQAALRGYAMEHGYEYLPVFEAFAAQSDGGASLVNPADGIHPTATTINDATTWCGNLLWAAVWMSVINAKRAAKTALTALP